MKIHEIIEGWKNHLIPSKHLKTKIEEVSAERLSICKDCEYNTTRGKVTNTSQCAACHCFLKPKSKCLSCNCGISAINAKLNKHLDPLPLKWVAVGTEEDDRLIDNEFNLNDDEEYTPDNSI